MTPTEVEQHLDTMLEPVEGQELVDQLTALVLLGKVDWYLAKKCVELRDWETAREVIAEAEDA